MLILTLKSYLFIWNSNLTDTPYFYLLAILLWMGLSWWLSGKESPVMQETQNTWVGSLGREDPLDEGMATHSSVLAWRIPWIEEPGGLQSTGLERVGHNRSNWEGMLLWIQPKDIVSYITHLYSLPQQVFFLSWLHVFPALMTPVREPQRRRVLEIS